MYINTPIADSDRIKVEREIDETMITFYCKYSSPAYLTITDDEIVQNKEELLALIQIINSVWQERGI